MFAWWLVRSLLDGNRSWIMTTHHILTFIWIHLIVLADVRATTFTALDVPLEYDWCRVLGMSSDGKFMVGECGASTKTEAFRWSEDTGMVLLGYARESDDQSFAYAVSTDGSVVTGSSRNSTTFEGQAFRWTSATGMVGLGDFPDGNFSSQGFGMSDDGNVIVGRGESLNQSIGFHWRSDSGLVQIGDLPGGVVQSMATDASADGSVIVGDSHIRSAVVAFRWTSDGGMVGLGHLSGGHLVKRSTATKVSADGNVVVGSTSIASSDRAMRWTQAGGMELIGALNAEGDQSGTARGVSADGETIVGNAADGSSPTGRAAFIWSEGVGMRNLQEELESKHGLDLSGWSLLSAEGVSDDGRIISGYGLSPGGFETGWIAEITPVSVSTPNSATYAFSGPIKVLNESVDGATYRSVVVGDEMNGTITIGETSAGSIFQAPDGYLFHNDRFFGEITGDGIETSTEFSTEPVEVRFNDNTVLDADGLAIVNACLGMNFPAGTMFDIVDVETRLLDGNRELEFGLSFLSTDLSYLTSTDYRSLPALTEVDLAIYFVTESIADVEVYSAIGQLTDFTEVVEEHFLVTEATLSGNLFTVQFTADPGITSWKVVGTNDLSAGFTDDLSAAPGTSVSESSDSPGSYTATVDVSENLKGYFIKVQTE